MFYTGFYYYKDTNSAVCSQALLTRVAKTGQGAVELLRCGLVAQLIECQVFDMVPDSDAHRYDVNYYYNYYPKIVMFLISC